MSVPCVAPPRSLADIRLLIKNAKVFNQPERVEWVMADALELTARKLSKRYLAQPAKAAAPGALPPHTPSKRAGGAPMAGLAGTPAPAGVGASSSRSGVSMVGTPAPLATGRARPGWVPSCGYGSDAGSVGPSGRGSATGGGGWDDIDAAGLD